MQFLKHSVFVFISSFNIWPTSIKVIATFFLTGTKREKWDFIIITQISGNMMHFVILGTVEYEMDKN